MSIDKHTKRIALRAALVGACTLFMQACSTTVAHVANADSRDISVLKLDRNQGGLQVVQTVPVGGMVMPMTVSPDKRFLYASLRSEPYTVMSFAIDGHTGQLVPIGVTPLPDSMANISTDRTGRWLFGASYGGHKISVSPIGANGVVGTVSSVIATGKNAHAAIADASNKHLFVTNLGSDQVLQFNFDENTGTLTPHAPPSMSVRAGAGPRHVVFHPNGRYAYLTNELDGGVDLLAYDAVHASLGPQICT